MEFCLEDPIAFSNFAFFRFKSSLISSKRTSIQSKTSSNLSAESDILSAAFERCEAAEENSLSPVGSHKPA